MQAQAVSFEDGHWLNKPPHVDMSPDRLTFETGTETDFWRKTLYGFIHDSGHARLVGVQAPFVAELTFSGRFRRKYQQAGILLRRDDTHWIKTGVEFADGLPNLATVVTRGLSDWSMAPASTATESWTFRVTLRDGAAIVHARIGDSWQILRVADFDADQVEIGPMACSPTSTGLRVAFCDFRLLPVPEDPLYLSD